MTATLPPGTFTGPGPNATPCSDGICRGLDTSYALDYFDCPGANPVPADNGSAGTLAAPYGASYNFGECCFWGTVLPLPACDFGADLEIVVRASFVFNGTDPTLFDGTFPAWIVLAGIRLVGSAFFTEYHYWVTPIAVSGGSLDCAVNPVTVGFNNDFPGDFDAVCLVDRAKSVSLAW